MTEYRCAFVNPRFASLPRDFELLFIKTLDRLPEPGPLRMQLAGGEHIDLRVEAITSFTFLHPGRPKPDEFDFYVVVRMDSPALTAALAAVERAGATVDLGQLAADAHRDTPPPSVRAAHHNSAHHCFTCVHWQGSGTRLLAWCSVQQMQTEASAYCARFSGRGE